MNILKIRGVPPWDGDYPFDDFVFTMRELNRIKVVTSVDGAAPVRGGDLIDALIADDAGAFVGVAAVVMARHGKNPSPDELWDAPKDAITIELGAEEEVVDNGPPSQRPSGDETDSGSDESTVSGGPDSESDGE